MMSVPQPSHPAIALLARETQLRRGPVLAELEGQAVPAGQHLLLGDSFLLHTEDAMRFLYRRGTGVLLDAPDDTDPREIALWLAGSIHAAIASINGLLPLHASAVALHGQVYAFAGPSGAGKSTLAAGLTRLGLPLFCDDTLVLDLSDPDRLLALPGHKRLKLWPEGAALAGVEPLEQVSESYPKVYVTPGGGDVAAALPLAALFFLGDGAEASVEPITGAAKLLRLADDHYTRRFFDAAMQHSRAERFALQVRLAQQVALFEFVRPQDPARFAATTAFLAAMLSDMAAA